MRRRCPNASTVKVLVPLRALHVKDQAFNLVTWIAESSRTTISCSVSDSMDDSKSNLLVLACGRWRQEEGTSWCAWRLSDL
ncbi:hypothetical protein R1flu_017766 [Riccia fluitans]|uniref:Uncharacterized protein n=1 Tax=Riccia fluitans TaxID=41844 RepID=A0ABD1ZE56_9MARC